MKTKFLWVALLASAALIAQAQAGGRYGGGGGGGGHFAAAHSAPARGGASSFRSMPMRSFGGGRGDSAQRFSPTGMRSSAPYAFRQSSINPNNGAFITTARSSNQTHQALASSRRTGSRADQSGRRGSNLPPNWRNHVVAQHSANWHRDWDHGREH